MKKNMYAIIASVIILLIAVFIFMPSKKLPVADSQINEGTIRIAMQYSMYYAPLYVMQEMGILEKYIPNVKAEWSVLGSGSPMNEALAADRLDIAFMGLGPALIGWDKGVVKIMSSLCVAPTSLQVKKPAIKTLADFKPSDKIALPNIGSIQHILLSLACAKQLGNPKALDNNLVSMTHPDGALAMISGSDISAHLTAMPYIVQEVNSGARTILTAKEALGGDCSIIVSVCTEKFRKDKPLMYAAFMSALSDAMTLINKRDPEAIKIIASHEKITPEQAIEYLDWEGTNYTTTLYGVIKIANHMAKSGYISKTPKSVYELTWEGASASIGRRSGEKSILEQAQEIK